MQGYATEPEQSALPMLAKFQVKVTPDGRPLVVREVLLPEPVRVWSMMNMVELPPPFLSVTVTEVDWVCWTSPNWNWVTMFPLVS